MKPEEFLSALASMSPADQAAYDFDLRMFGNAFIRQDKEGEPYRHVPLESVYCEPAQ